MQEYIQFAVNHWLLAGLFVALLILLFIEEARSKGMLGQLTAHQAVQLINRERAVVIDLRSRELFQAGHIVDSVNIPQADLEKDFTKVQKYKDRPIILVCALGQKAGVVAVKLKKANAVEQVHVLSGGIGAWKSASMPLVKN